MKLFLSCEHGGNRVPENYKFLFVNASQLLETHRGYDKGAIELYNSLKLTGFDFAISNEITRLLVDFNRSLHRRSLFSEFSGVLRKDEKLTILNKYYLPYRNLFRENAIKMAESGEFVFHISVHAFTPVLNGIERNADIGILYNPSHGIEKSLATKWKKELKFIFPDFKIRYNYPYLGKTDGHVAPLRKLLGKNYAGIEFELNSKHSESIEVREGIVQSFKELIKFRNSFFT